MSSLDAARASANRLYCPIVFKLAARLEQLTWADFILDPIDMAAALRNAQTALGGNLLVNWFDTWSECETLGAPIVRDPAGNLIAIAPPPSGVSDPLTILKSELLPKLKDLAIRLNSDRRSGTLVAGFVTGMSTLARRIGGPQAANLAIQWAIELIRAYGEIGLDSFIIAEEEPGIGAFYSDFAKELQPIFNLSRYYSRPLIVLNRRPAEDDQLKLAAAGFICDNTPARMLIIAGGSRLGTIRLIPEELLDSPSQQSNEMLNSMLAGIDDGRQIFITSWETPVDIEPERLAELGRRLRSAG
ncbi:MAG: hypothetical protein IVW54_13580 [Candidatus Binataceae bacterium]|nr:hypothetical protein [Candidatus Binataceae bacterium]